MTQETIDGFKIIMTAAAFVGFALSMINATTQRIIADNGTSNKLESIDLISYIGAVMFALRDKEGNEAWSRASKVVGWER